MANPTANLTAPKTNLVPGEVVRVTLAASDTDSRQITLTGTVTDGAGNTGQATLVLSVADVLSLSLTASPSTGVMIQPVAGQPGVYDVTV